MKRCINSLHTICFPCCRIAILIACCLLAARCLYALENAGQAKGPAFTQADGLSKADEYYNDIARYISGIKLNEQSTLYSLTKYEAWQSYVSVTNATWAAFKKNKIKKISDWSQAEIDDVRKGAKTVFYPFSGPDFLYVYTLFPDTDAYILMGLEPVGVVPDLRALDKDLLPGFFKMLDRSIEDALTISFFKTTDMTEELGSRQLITGTLPVLMLFLARTDNKIISIRPVEIDAAGGIAPRESFAMDKGNKRFGKGAEIQFQGRQSGRIQKLYYFCADISDNGLSQNQQCRAFVDRLDSNLTTFIKSASYLMHKNYFSHIRGLLLNKSSVILQDDSAIPYRYFKKSSWDIQLYGAYTGPIGMFKEHYEEDLKAAYEKNIRKISFRLGYAPQSNLLLAKKKSLM